MPNHHSRNTTDILPTMTCSWKTSRNNTNHNRDDFLDKASKTPEYKRVFNHETGKLTIWFVKPNDIGIKVETSNTVGSCTIVIQHFSLGKELSRDFHEFHPLGFSESVSTYLLTPEDLEQQRAFRQQEQERKDALERAHNSNPPTCDRNTCEYCANARRYEWSFPRPLGSYT